MGSICWSSWRATCPSCSIIFIWQTIFFTFFRLIFSQIKRAYSYGADGKKNLGDNPYPRELDVFVGNEEEDSTEDYVEYDVNHVIHVNITDDESEESENDFSDEQ